MRRYYITDRKAAGGTDRLLRCIERAIAGGVEMVQIREKDLDTRELLTLTRHAVALAANTATKILVNTRADIAVAAGAHGVHLPGAYLSPRQIRQIVPASFVVGVSCHTRMELETAESARADFAVFGPVFPSSGKGAPTGLQGLRDAVAGVQIPVFALGGLNEENAADCLAAGAAGVAAITWFQREC